MMMMRNNILNKRVGVKQFRQISSTRICKGGSVDSHHAYDDGSNESYAPSDLLSSGWLKFFGVVGLSAFGLTAFSTLNEDRKPFITRYLEYNKPSIEQSKASTDRLLQLKKELADETLLLADAHRPKLIRLSNTGTFDQASPHKISPGSQADLADLKIKSKNDDN